MAKKKKSKFTWWKYRHTPYAFCENTELVLSVHTYGNDPHISFSLSVAEYTPQYTSDREAVWENGLRITPTQTTTRPRWYYLMNASVAHAQLILTAKPGWHSDGDLTNRGVGYTTRQEAIKAGLNEFVTACELVLSRETPAPFWWPRRGRYQYAVGREQLAFYLCMPQWEPMWALLEEVTRHDDWLNECRAPKQSVFTEQLQMF